MIWGQPKQASSATMAITFITVGSLTDVWTIIYYIYLRGHQTDDTTFLWVYGFFFTGVVLMAIGFMVGRIGRSAKQAEVSAQPTVVTNTVAAPAAAVPATTTAPVAAAPLAPAPAAAPVSVPPVATTAARR